MPLPGAPNSGRDIVLGVLASRREHGREDHDLARPLSSSLIEPGIEVGVAELIERDDDRQAEGRPQMPGQFLGGSVKGIIGRSARPSAHLAMEFVISGAVLGLTLC